MIWWPLHYQDKNISGFLTLVFQHKMKCDRNLFVCRERKRRVTQETLFRQNTQTHTRRRPLGFAAEIRSECDSQRLQEIRVWFCKTLDKTYSSFPIFIFCHTKYCLRFIYKMFTAIYGIFYFFLNVETFLCMCQKHLHSTVYIYIYEWNRKIIYGSIHVKSLEASRLTIRISLWDKGAPKRGRGPVKTTANVTLELSMLDAWNLQGLLSSIRRI